MELLEEVIEKIESCIQAIASEAQDEVDNHWLMLGFGNKDRHTSDLGHHAPRIRIYSTGSVNIMWERWPYRKDKAKKRAIRIVPTKSGYTESCFTKARDWELKLIMNTEMALRPLRESVKNLQATKNAIAREIRRIPKITTTPNDEIGEVANGH